MAYILDSMATDYDSIKAKLTSIIQEFGELKDFQKSSTGVMVIELLAYVNEMLAFYVNDARVEMNSDIARRRGNLLQLARSFGYDLFYGIPSRGYANITWSLASLSGGNIWIPQYTYFRSNGGVNFMTIEGYELADLTGTATLRIRQGTLRTATLGQSNGQSHQKFRIPTRYVTVPNAYDIPLIDVVLSAGVTPAGSDFSSPWTFRNSLVASTDADQHFTVYLDEDNYTWIKFGDGVFGKVPELGATVSLIYEENVGSLGNIKGTDLTQFNANNMAVANGLTFDVTTVSGQTLVNGRDPDSNTNLRENIKQWNRTQNRSVSPSDFKDLFGLNKGTIRSHTTTFNELYSIVSRAYTIPGSYTNTSAFASGVSGTFQDLSAYYDRPYLYTLNAITGNIRSATGFAVAPTDIYIDGLFGADLVYYPDFDNTICGFCGPSANGAPMPQTMSAWFNNLAWTNLAEGADNLTANSGSVLGPQMVARLNDFMNIVAPPLINANVSYVLPEIVWMNLALNVEVDPGYHGSTATIAEGIKQTMWGTLGFTAKDVDNAYATNFGSKMYLNEIEQVIYNGVNGILAVNIPNTPKFVVTNANSNGTPIAGLTGGFGLNPYTIDISGGMWAVSGQEYYGNTLTGSTAYSGLPRSGAPAYVSGYGFFWNPEERSITMKRNQLAIWNISGIHCT